MEFISSIEVFLENGFMYAVMALGYFVTYNILDFPDLTVEGTVLTGGVVFALMIGCLLYTSARAPCMYRWRALQCPGGFSAGLL